MTPDTQAMTEIGLEVLSGGRTVHFAGEERLTCNGVDLPLKGRVAVFQVLWAPPARAAGTSIRCDECVRARSASPCASQGGDPPPAPGGTLLSCNGLRSLSGASGTALAGKEGPSGK
jgi:hypothetical protein